MSASTPLKPLRPGFECGFTALEILLVITLLAIVLALAFPSYDAVLKKTRAVEVERVFSEQRRALEIYHHEHQSYGDGSAASNHCGVLMPSGRYYRFQCVTRHAAGADSAYVITAIPLALTAHEPEAMVNAPLHSVDQDGQRESRSVLVLARQLAMACIPGWGVGC